MRLFNQGLVGHQKNWKVQPSNRMVETCWNLLRAGLGGLCETRFGHHSSVACCAMRHERGPWRTFGVTRDEARSIDFLGLWSRENSRTIRVPSNGNWWDLSLSDWWVYRFELATLTQISTKDRLSIQGLVVHPGPDGTEARNRPEDHCGWPGTHLFGWAPNFKMISHLRVHRYPTSDCRSVHTFSLRNPVLCGWNRTRLAGPVENLSQKQLVLFFWWQKPWFPVDFPNKTNPCQAPRSTDDVSRVKSNPGAHALFGRGSSHGWKHPMDLHSLQGQDLFHQAFSREHGAQPPGRAFASMVLPVRQGQSCNRMSKASAWVCRKLVGSRQKMNHHWFMFGD